MNLANAAVLIVDDAATVRACLRQILAAIGIAKIHDAASGSRAMALLAEQKYDLILLDIELPDCNGCKLLQEIKTKFGPVHVVMCTSNNSADNVRTAIMGGAAGFIIKPFAPQKIKELVMKCLAERR